VPATARAVATERARLSLPARARGFRHVNTPYGTLVLPSATKNSWSMDERWFRSVILNEHGQVVSVGFPKFANVGENGFEDHLQDLRTAIANHEDVWLTDKVDGSLIVRSVIDGVVVWRTRGHWRLNAFEAPVMALVRTHPLLLDPTFSPSSSLLFEFTSSSPDLRVVLAHEEDGLTLLAAVDHQRLQLAERPALQELAQASGVPLVASVQLAGGLKEWKREIGAWAGREGVVIRLARGQMLKLKSASYLTLHRLKTQFSLRATKRMIINSDLNSFAQFEAHLRGLGADFEIIREVEPLIVAAMAAREFAATRFSALEDEVDLICISNPGKRSVQARVINERFGEAERQAALLLLDGRHEEARTALGSILLQEALEPFEDPVQEAADE